ncbi:hypothetical protein TcBrA4_0000970 [Trypanosoma cruzi]|nr:hypothetical protein TcBrA4_0000970 [Trypanosoma cruzi]
MRLFTDGSLGGYSRTSFRCRVGFVDLVESTLLHTGHEVYSGSSLRRREGLGGRTRDGKTAVCCAARGGILLDLRVSGPVDRGEVWFGGTNVRSRSGAGRRTGGPCQGVRIYWRIFHPRDEERRLEHDESTRIEEDCVSPNAGSWGCGLCGGAGNPSFDGSFCFFQRSVSLSVVSSRSGGRAAIRTERGEGRPRKLPEKERVCTGIALQSPAMSAADASMHGWSGFLLWRAGERVPNTAFPPTTHRWDRQRPKFAARHAAPSATAMTN